MPRSLPSLCGPSTSQAAGPFAGEIPAPLQTVQLH